jgi:hypothetical protein
MSAVQSLCGNRKLGCSHGEFLTKGRVTELDKLLVVGENSKELTNTLVRTTYIRDSKIERKHASESLRVLSVKFGHFGISGNCNAYTLTCDLRMIVGKRAGI